MLKLLYKIIKKTICITFNTYHYSSNKFAANKMLLVLLQIILIVQWAVNATYFKGVSSIER